VSVRRRWSVWPQNEDREYTDYIYNRLLAVCDARYINPCGSVRVSFWDVEVTDYEALQLREMEAEEVSEAIILFQI
jgi:hypothetical protein